MTEWTGAACSEREALRAAGRWPLRWIAGDAGTDDGCRQVEIAEGRVVIRRQVAGARMKLQVPLTAYRGVALALVDDGMDDHLSLTLVHDQPDLSVVLQGRVHADEAVADWQSWSRILGRPLLLAEPDGSCRQPFPSLGALAVGRPAPRRRRHSALRGRRPQALARRKAGGRDSGAVHREREIITRS